MVRGSPNQVIKAFVIPIINQFHCQEGASNPCQFSVSQRTGRYKPVVGIDRQFGCKLRTVQYTKKEGDAHKKRLN
jgi:hypothetical protein